MNPLLSYLERESEYVRLCEALEKGRGPVSVFGMAEAHRAHIAAALASSVPLLYLCANEQNAARVSEDIAAFGVSGSHFPARETFAQEGVSASSGLTERRMQTLSAAGKMSCSFICLSSLALLQRLISPEKLEQMSVSLKLGECIDQQELIKKLVEGGYTRSQLCEGRGQFALRGGYLDVFPVSADDPVRIELFDDEIDTMRTYDPFSQRSLENITEITITPANEIEEHTGDHCILDYLPENTALFLDEPARIEESAKAALEESAERLNSPLQTISRMSTPRTLMSFMLTRSYGLIAPKETIRIETRAATNYLGNEKLLQEDMLSWRSQKYATVLCAGAHAESLQTRLKELDLLVPLVKNIDRPLIPGETLIADITLGHGFVYPESKLAVLSEQELYGSVKKKKAASRKRPQMAFSELSVGDLIVHELYGIGRFAGIETLTVGTEKTPRDYMLLRYAAGDKLYIPTDQLDRVQKYVGGEEETHLSKLGSGEWQKTVNHTRESVKKLAFDLVALYGERSKRKGFKYSPDTSWQQRLENSFPYEETEDQLRCIAEIKQDMQSEKVMDRLLCGDVGYGKTEVALRACFKAVQDSKQAAILVPTTILAQQHYNTLKSRFSGFPVEVALLSRFNTPAEEKRILEGIEAGTIDVVVGTHKLLSKKIKYHDLGLLIIDEEQRFGVGHKEQIKEMKKSVDVLTLTATPIPRTLHMSMTGIRDMSVIETPPENRYPVQTYVMEYNEAAMREAILKEINRCGQAYFVYNRVQGMELFADKLRELVPEARITFAHGQMGERQLEKTMLAFMEGEYDVLLCSTIIESGLDISNVNTIIVYDADHMGLSQLYQLRGRVGRDVRLGYAYLTFRKDKVLSEVAEKRLNAIREFTQFGSGFKIAMRDLEIRGAGNLLGPEQSGHMAAVGYEMYCKLVDSAVKEAKGEPVKQETDTVMEVRLAAFIPHAYISREVDRLSMYKRIALITNGDDRMDVQDELIDRFGDIPQPVQNLIDIAVLKAAASQAYVNRLSIGEGVARLYFDPMAPFDLIKLYSLISETEGASLKQSEAPVLSLVLKGENSAQICRSLPQFVYMLRDCIDA